MVESKQDQYIWDDGVLRELYILKGSDDGV
jgi:hypothetical protein